MSSFSRRDQLVAHLLLLHYPYPHKRHSWWHLRVKVSSPSEATSLSIMIRTIATIVMTSLHSLQNFHLLFPLPTLWARLELATVRAGCADSVVFSYTRHVRVPRLSIPRLPQTWHHVIITAAIVVTECQALAYIEVRQLGRPGFKVTKTLKLALNRG